jgi:hypothetical protein
MLGAQPVVGVQAAAAPDLWRLRVQPEPVDQRRADRATVVERKERRKLGQDRHRGRRRCKKDFFDFL